MKRAFAIAALLIALSTACEAEPRWCSITGRTPKDGFYYPAIARAARVAGVVLSRIIYSPDGTVLRVEPISGPRLLSDSLAAQMMKWQVQTDAKGSEECQTLVIAHFRMLDSRDTNASEQKEFELPSILRLLVEAEPLTIDVMDIDPAPLRGWKLWRYEIKNMFRGRSGSG
jgi:hypothetical protein